jgi:crossover junction endodeoxyribonuclease RuvC
MRVLGIDPGLQVTGYGVLSADSDQPCVVEAGVVRSNAKEELSQRLLEISRELDDIMTQFTPDVIAVEELYSHYDHPTTAIIMGHVRGIIFLKAAEKHIPVVSYAATRVKKALTGNGRATKDQMQKMITVTLGLPSVPEPPDAADALAIALCHCRAMRHSEGMVA